MNLVRQILSYESKFRVTKEVHSIVLKKEFCFTFFKFYILYTEFILKIAVQNAEKLKLLKHPFGLFNSVIIDVK